MLYYNVVYYIGFWSSKRSLKRKKRNIYELKSTPIRLSTEEEREFHRKYYEIVSKIFEKRDIEQEKARRKFRNFGILAA